MDKTLWWRAKAQGATRYSVVNENRVDFYRPIGGGVWEWCQLVLGTWTTWVKCPYKGTPRGSEEL